MNSNIYILKVLGIHKMKPKCKACGKELTYFNGVKLIDSKIHVCGSVAEDFFEANTECLLMAVIKEMEAKRGVLNTKVEPIESLE